MCTSNKQSLQSVQRSSFFIHSHRLLILRLLTAFALFAVIGQANVWLSPVSNVLLAIGYRTFLIFVPLILLWLNTRSVSVCILMAIAGLTILARNVSPSLEILAVCLFAAGLSILGYITKSEAAVTLKGSSSNKIMLNLGSLLAGVVLMFTGLVPAMFYGGLAFMLFCFLPFIWKIDLSNTIKSDKHFSRILTGSNKRVWLIAGLLTGIKLFAVFTILPQYLLVSHGSLPSWYGGMIILNGLLVVILQHPVANLIERLPVSNTIIYLAMLAIGVLVLSLPNVFQVSTLMGAVIWIVLLSISECALCFIDHAAKQNEGLLLKELSVGLGAGFSVLIMRYIPIDYSPKMIGGSALCLLITWCWLVQKEWRKNNAEG